MIRLLSDMLLMLQCLTVTIFIALSAGSIHRQPDYRTWS